MLVILLIFLETSMITTSLNMKKRIERASNNKKGETSCWSHRLLSLSIVPNRFAFDQLVHSP